MTARQMRIDRILHIGAGLYPCRATLLHFTGCTLGCEGCWNPHLWNAGNAKKLHSPEVLAAIVNASARGNDSKLLVISGGEPLQQPYFWEFVGRLRSWDVRNQVGHSDEKTIFLYTGYDLDEIPGLRKRLEDSPIGGVCAGRYVHSLASKAIWPASSTNQEVVFYNDRTEALVKPRTGLVLINEDETTYLGLEGK